jgi:hypothetical protein
MSDPLSSLLDGLFEATLLALPLLLGCVALVWGVRSLRHRRRHGWLGIGVATLFLLLGALGFAVVSAFSGPWRLL